MGAPSTSEKPAPDRFNDVFHVVVADTPERLASLGAGRIAAIVRRKPDALLCAPTGNTPTRTYERLAEMHVQDAELLRRLRVLKLDEWGGLRMEDPATCESYLRRHLLGPLAVDSSRYAGFHSRPPNPQAECDRLRRWLQHNGPVDLCVLGLGLNGHLALNEPAAVLAPFAHVARLTPQSLRHSMLAAANHPPAYGLTLGMAEILASKEILLLVSGAAKRDVLARLVHPEIRSQFPASFLWLHREVTILCDREAAAGLPVRSVPGRAAHA